MRCLGLGSVAVACVELAAEHGREVDLQWLAWSLLPCFMFSRTVLCLRTLASVCEECGEGTRAQQGASTCSGTRYHIVLGLNLDFYSFIVEDALCNAQRFSL